MSRQTELPFDTELVARLRASLKGRVIAPEDADYDAARTIASGAYDRRPAAITRAAGPEDVVKVVTFARESGRELAVRSGGHSSAGHSTTERGIVLDLRDLKRLDIDPSGRTAWAEAGLTAGEYTAAAGAHGLATGFGDTGSVGLGGLVTGGGVGYLARKFGLTVDNLLAAELVTASGQMLRVDARSHPDLFWAIRGGGGNFGVVTRFQFRLHEVSDIVGGMLVLPATAENIVAFLAAADAAPEELSTIANIMPAPPLPFLPPKHHGQLILMALLAHCGGGEAGRKAVAPFRAIARPIADLVRPMRYPELYPPEQEGYHPMAIGRTTFLDAVDRGSAELILRNLQASRADMAVTQLRVLGGAVARVAPEATAYAHRDRRIMAHVAAVYARPEQKAEHEAWASGFLEALRQGKPGAYVNFLGEEGPARVREAFPGSTWDRLVAVKSQYDPTNLFRLNQNIPPEAKR